MKVTLTKKKKVILCLILIFAVLLAGLYLFINWNNYFFDPVEVSKVESVTIEICGLFFKDITAEIHAQESIQKLSDAEDIVRKSDGECPLIKAKPWQIKYEYRLMDGNTISRPYSGQKSLVELQSAFADIPEIRSVIDNNQAVDNASS